ncbi:hypothetical protein E2C06_22530 [Dankookia rubra]|uniref:Uncharacterized protein n=1 Tax=Dankookia rubra TaxID=1442381 RepID=A0A4R5QBD3_9PROT|nr:hypothetical protein [Dankookia rubra]TDH60400.1 hypothetical protein E2C06_22530 [Dankookia rubra]
MFPKGTIVYHRDSGRSGRVLECDGGTVYILQDNGAELDLPGAELTTRRPDALAPGRPDAQRPAAAVNTPRLLTRADITPEHEQVYASIPPLTLQAVAALHDRGAQGKRFGALDLAAKLNAVAAITAVPYRIMRQHRGNPGELKLLMGKGLADSQRKAG